MTNKLKEEINVLQSRTASELVLSWELHRLNLLLLVAEHYLSVQNPEEAHSWLQSIFQWIEPEFRDDMKNHATDLNAWFNQQMDNVIDTKKAMEIVRKQYPSIERLRNDTALPQNSGIKHHQLRDLVDAARDTAIKYQGCECLREALSVTIKNYLINSGVKIKDE